VSQGGSVPGIKLVNRSDRIADDRSSDLKETVSSVKADGKEMARSAAPEANALRQ
jgi:hypothetical protein